MLIPWALYYEALAVSAAVAVGVGLCVLSFRIANWIADRLGL